MKNKTKKKLIGSQERIRTKTDFHSNKTNNSLKTFKEVAILEQSFDTYHIDMENLFHRSYNPFSSDPHKLNEINVGDTTNIHGTAVAGIIKQFYHGKLMPVIFNPYNTFNSIKSLNYASENADIVNISLTLSQGHVYKSIEESIKTKLDQIFNSNKLFILAASNAYQSYESTPYFQDLSNLTIDKRNVIFVGATVNVEGLEVLWKCGSKITSKRDNSYQFKLGSSYPGKLTQNQSNFLVAPSDNYTTFSDGMIPSSAYKYFAMTSSSAPIVTAIAVNLWSQFPDKSAIEIGSALLEGGSFKYLDRESKELYGKGMVNYSNSYQILQCQGVTQNNIKDSTLECKMRIR